MKKNKLYTLIFALLLIGITNTAFSQKYTIKGKVVDFNTNKSIYYATVNIKRTQIYDLTDQKGNFTLKNIPKGKFKVVVKIIGYQEFEKEIVVDKDIENLVLKIKESSLALNNIVVTAKVSQSKKGSTTYKIDNEAIKQIQPMSLNDILSLLPGNKLGETDLSKANYANLRNVGETNVGINQFGTSVIMDGNQLSGDANLQNIGADTHSNGIDLRNISASNIESVEVISGVASAKYGNLSSGAIIVKRKAGYTPLYVSLNNTPNSYQGSIGKGFSLGNAGFLNTDLDYTYSIAEPTSIKNYYQRINSGLRWTKEISEDLNWSNNMSLNIAHSFNGERKDPDETVKINEINSKNTDLQFSTNGSLQFLGNTSYSFGLNYSKQETSQDEVKNGPFPIMEATEDKTYVTKYTPISFYQKTKSIGEPLNINARLDNEFSFNTFGFSHRLNTGLEFTFNKNYGKGVVVDKKEGEPSTGVRAMNFHNLPASKIYSAYMQDDINICKENSVHIIKLGLRYDRMIDKYNLFSPRLSFSGLYFKKFRVRLAYGLSYKAPSLIQIYPAPEYVDIINKPNYSEDDIQSSAVITTYVHQPENEHLKPSKGTTLEGGFDFEGKGFNIRITGFRKKIENGIGTVPEIIAYKKDEWVINQTYQDKLPDFKKTGNYTYVLQKMDYYANSLSTTTNGVELSCNFPKLELTNTNFSLTGSYMESESTRSNLSIDDPNDGDTQMKRYGVFENPEYVFKKATANFTIIQHIPQIKMLITLITEANFLQRKDLTYEASRYPLGYYKADGSYTPIPEADRMNEEYKDITRLSDFDKTNPVPTYFNFHLQLRKETKQGHSFSFYANNYLWYNPTYYNEVIHKRVYLNDRINFGLGINFKF